MTPTPDRVPTASHRVPESLVGEEGGELLTASRGGRGKAPEGAFPPGRRQSHSQPTADPHQQQNGHRVPEPVRHRFDPELLGPITRPIFEALTTLLNQLDYPAFLTHSDLRAQVVALTGCNPKTFDSLLYNTRSMGLTYGAKRIRLTTLGAWWLNHELDDEATP